MEELRHHLHSQETSPISITKFIEFLGQASAGRDTGPSIPAQDASPSAWPSSAWVQMQGLLLRGFAKAYRDFLRAAGSAIRHRLSSSEAVDNETNWPEIDQIKYRQFEPLMGGLLSMRTLRKAAFRYPPLLDMPPEELALRMVGLKQLLGGCDVPLLVEREPALFLAPSQQEVACQVQRGMALLQQGLAGADLHQVIMLDPALLFMPELERGIKELRELWDVDEEAMAVSDPQMLALAVRALSVTGLPAGL